MEEVCCLVSLGPHYSLAQGSHAEKAKKRRRGTEGIGLLTFNDCLWMISTNKQPFCICVSSVSSLATD